MKNFTVLLFIMVNLEMFSQTFKPDTMLLKGTYYGKNIYAQNPQLTKGTDTIYTAQQVIVNDSLVLNSTQLHKSTFAIPLTKLHLNEGDAVTIKIIQWNFNRVKILNEMNCFPKKTN